MSSSQSCVRKLQRLLYIIETLRIGNRQLVGDMAANLKMTKRTIFRDLRLLKDVGYLINYDDETQTHYLSGVSGPHPHEISADQIIALVVVRNAFQGLSGSASCFSDFICAADAIVSMSKYADKREIEIARMIDINIEPPSCKCFESIVAAAKNRYKIRCRFTCAGSLYDSTVVHCYRITYWRDKWYVIGRSTVHSSVVALACDAIMDVEALDEKYSTPPRFSVQRYLSSAGLTVVDKDGVTKLAGGRERDKPLVHGDAA